MLLLLSFLVTLTLLFAFARQRAEIIRLRLERRLAYVAPGSWEPFRRLPPAAPPAPGWLRGA